MRHRRELRVRGAAGFALLLLTAAIFVFARGGDRSGGEAASPEQLEGRHEIVARGYGMTARRHVYAAGKGAAMHEHAAPRLVVVLSGGTLEARAPDGTVRVVELETGAVSFRPAEAHALRNVGVTTIEIIEVEIPPAD